MTAHQRELCAGLTRSLLLCVVESGAEQASKCSCKVHSICGEQASKWSCKVHSICGRWTLPLRVVYR